MGILEGIGNVFINMSLSDRYDSGYQINIGYSICSKSKSYLEYASELFEKNGIGYYLANNKLTVSKQSELVSLIVYCDQFTFKNPKKKREFKILRECVRLQHRKEHVTIKGVEKLKKLKTDLKNSKRL